MIELKVNKQNAKNFNDKLKNMQKFLSNQGNYSDQTLFETYCNYFRRVCSEIGNLIEYVDFKGDINQVFQFYASNEYKTEKGVQLAIALDTCRGLCQYQAEKLNIYNQWFDKCWENILIKLGILTKPLAQYTIGQSIFIPYTDTSNVITSPIEFQVVGINHHKENSLTLMTKNIIRFAAFDCPQKEQSASDISLYGNNRWSLSNIRQWLNSTKGAYSWWSPTHEYDLIINSDGFDSSLIATSPGFLSGFSSETLQHFATVQNVTVLVGGGYETTQDKAFLPSITELFNYRINGIQEGNYLSEKFVDDNSRIKKFNGTNSSYWIRSPWTSLAYLAKCVNDSGSDNSIYAANTIGCAPLVVLI